MSNEQIYLYRRKGLSDYATCDRARYVELSQHKLFETMVCYASPEPEEGDHDGRQLEWERAENKRLKTIADNYSALLMDANAKLAGRDALLSKATAFVQSLCDAAGSQPSVATGYLRDILDALSAGADSVPASVVLPDSGELSLLVARSAGQADRLHGCNHYTACQMTANNLMDRIKELNS